MVAPHRRKDWPLWPTSQPTRTIRIRTMQARTARQASALDASFTSNQKSLSENPCAQRLRITISRRGMRVRARMRIIRLSKVSQISASPISSIRVRRLLKKRRARSVNCRWRQGPQARRRVSNIQSLGKIKCMMGLVRARLVAVAQTHSLKQAC